MSGSNSGPILEKIHDEGDRKSFRWGASSMQGWPKYQQDAFSANSKLTSPHFEQWAFFGVYDGHAGGKVANALKDRLFDVVIKEITENLNLYSHDNMLDTIKSKHLKSDQAQPEGKVAATTETISENIARAFMNMDDEIRAQVLVQSKTSNEESERSGSTAVCVFMSQSHIFVAHCGDSRAIYSKLKGKDGQQSIEIKHTKDHKPTVDDEKKRIEKAGGKVINSRVYGSLAVSRSFGDFDYKTTESLPPEEQAVTALPEVKCYSRRLGRDELIILGCDGIFDVFRNEELREFTRHLLKCYQSMAEVCDQIVETALFKGSRDNITVIVIAFRADKSHFDEKYAEEMKQKEIELTRIAASILDEDKYNAIDTMFALMAEMSKREDVAKLLPKGVCLQSKRRLIEQTFNKVMQRRKNDIAKATEDLRGGSCNPK